MIYHCEFDPQRDICKTIPDMSVDLAAAIESGVVLDTGTIAEHNDIDSPGSILGRVRDCFDAFDAKKRILAAGRIKLESAPPLPVGMPPILLLLCQQILLFNLFKRVKSALILT